MNKFGFLFLIFSFEVFSSVCPISGNTLSQVFDCVAKKASLDVNSSISYDSFYNNYIEPVFIYLRDDLGSSSSVIKDFFGNNPNFLPTNIKGQKVSLKTPLRNVQAMLLPEDIIQGSFKKSNFVNFDKTLYIKYIESFINNETNGSNTGCVADFILDLVYVFWSGQFDVDYDFFNEAYQIGILNGSNKGKVVGIALSEQSSIISQLSSSFINNIFPVLNSYINYSYLNQKYNSDSSPLSCTVSGQTYLINSNVQFVQYNNQIDGAAVLQADSNIENYVFPYGFSTSGSGANFKPSVQNWPQWQNAAYKWGYSSYISNASSCAPVGTLENKSCLTIINNTRFGLNLIVQWDNNGVSSSNINPYSENYYCSNSWNVNRISGSTNDSSLINSYDFDFDQYTPFRADWQNQQITFNELYKSFNGLSLSSAQAINSNSFSTIPISAVVQEKEKAVSGCDKLKKPCSLYKNIRDRAKCFFCNHPNAVSKISKAGSDPNDFFNDFILPYFNSISGQGLTNYSSSTNSNSIAALYQVLAQGESSSIIVDCDYWTNLRFLILPEELKSVLQTRCQYVNEDALNKQYFINPNYSLNYLIPVGYFFNDSTKNNIDSMYKSYVSSYENQSGLISDIVDIFAGTAFDIRYKEFDFFQDVYAVRCGQGNLNPAYSECPATGVSSYCTNSGKIVGFVIDKLQKEVNDLSDSFVKNFKSYLTSFLNYNSTFNKFPDNQNNSVIPQKNIELNLYSGTPTVDFYQNADFNVSNYCYPSSVYFNFHYTPPYPGWLYNNVNEIWGQSFNISYNNTSESVPFYFNQSISNTGSMNADNCVMVNNNTRFKTRIQFVYGTQGWQQDPGLHPSVATVNPFSANWFCFGGYNYIKTLIIDFDQLNNGISTSPPSITYTFPSAIQLNWQNQHIDISEFFTPFAGKA